MGEKYKVGESWTAEQLEAIFCRGSDILVTAGAGSGKTKVLVERLLRRITDPLNAVDLDKLLVVTFTNAAASEMKQRINAALEKALQEKPSSQNLHRQLLLLNRASITTVHSFCLEVIRRYYYLENLDPFFRLLDEAGADLLQQEILEELLEEYYDAEDPASPFYRLVETYSGDRGDQPLQALILRLYSFARSHPFPSLWLQQNKEAFHSASTQQVDENPWFNIAKTEVREELKSIVAAMEVSLKLAGAPGGPTPYQPTISQELAALRETLAASAGAWDKLFSIMQYNPFDNLKACRGDKYDPELKEETSRNRKMAKEGFNKLKDDYFARPAEEYLKEMEKIAALIGVLVELTEVFSSRYEQAKREKGVADFSDLEHFALRILNDPGDLPGRLSPSSAALEYRNHFAEIMIDEYQDINQIQEAILTLIASPAPDGNRFMVGDVKQSIYRFRLAEPELFLRKQGLYSGTLPPSASLTPPVTPSGALRHLPQGGRLENVTAKGRCIYLNKNFRSRREILDGINYLFSRIMDETVGEIAYNDDAKLYYGGLYPPPHQDEPIDSRLDLMLIDRSASIRVAEDGAEEGEGEKENPDDQEEEWEAASLEGRLIALQIKHLMGDGDSPPLEVYDRDKKVTRKAAYGDIAILLRSSVNYAAPVLEELHGAGIPALADLGGGFFDAVEVNVILSLLAVIDNPLQDLPLAAVLRSPLLGLKAEELALIRAAAPDMSFCEAFFSEGAAEVLPRERREETLRFIANLTHWQKLAVRGSLTDLIREVYRETGYYNLVGGMPGGKQRQANLQALHDRAAIYESSAGRGLFRFLSFVEKLKERGEDMAPARIMSEQENVVRIITVHKSKGLEFPVVFLAGLNKVLNQQDLNHNFLLHKTLGFGPKYIDTENRLIYSTLPWFALRKQLHRELLAEEMRILYVAMTRAEERLFLVATVKDLDTERRRWELEAAISPNLCVALPAHYRSKARRALDWIGPALCSRPDPTLWRISVYRPSEIVSGTEENMERQEKRLINAEPYGDGSEKNVMLCLDSIFEQSSFPESGESENDWFGQVARRLSWLYPWSNSAARYAKISVSELLKLSAAGLTDGYVPQMLFKSEIRSPEDMRTDPTVRGSAFHTVMQRLELTGSLRTEEVRRQLEKMHSQGYLTEEEYKSVDPSLIAAFFTTSAGERVVRATEADLWRELPFTLLLPVNEIYDTSDTDKLEKGKTSADTGNDLILIQGVIDCLIREEGGLILIDYKTGYTSAGNEQNRESPYVRQLYYYALAMEKILGLPVMEKYLYFFDSGRLLGI